jgi:hypothetical protein
MTAILAIPIPTSCKVRRRQLGEKPVSVAETVVNLTRGLNQTKKPNEIWSEWQDLNLRPLRPERSALPG